MLCKIYRILTITIVKDNYRYNLTSTMPQGPLKTVYIIKKTQ